MMAISRSPHCAITIILSLIAINLNVSNSFHIMTPTTNTPFTTRAAVGMKTHKKRAFFRLHSTQKDDSEDEDDGWGDDTVDVSIGELQSLQKQSTPSSTNNNQAQIQKQQQTQEPERDLFIPIFAVISLTGFFGAYAYETFRLYQQGELYLPWN